MKKIIVFYGHNTNFIDRIEMFAHVMDLDEQGWNELGSTLVLINHRIDYMINQYNFNAHKVLEKVRLPFKKQLGNLYNRHGMKVDWRFLPYQGDDDVENVK